MPKEINWSSTPEDRALIRQIVERASQVKIGNRPWVHRNDKINVAMSITACHLNGCPLRLADLLTADDFNFIHDVGGIDNNVSHETGEMLNFFRPRFAAKRGG